MADTSTGALSAAQLITFFDALASQFKGQYANLGIGSSTETTTLSAYAKTARAKILGDGASNPGVGNAAFQAAIKDSLATLAANSRYDSFFANVRSLVNSAQAQVASNLPSGWVFTSSTQTQALDSHLLRLNAMNASAPATPASAGVSTAANSLGGGLATVVAGSAPRIVHTLVSASGQWLESLPSAEATQAAISGANNSYSYQISGTVPAGVAYVRIYRGLVGGAGGTYYYDGQTAVTPGAAYPAIVIKQADGFLRTDWTPPSWASCLMTPEAAAIFALAFASASLNPGASGGPLVFTSGAMLSSTNVVLTPTTGFLGIGNPAQNGIFGTQVVGTGFTAGSIAGTNNAATNTQGFVGAGGAANIVQARVTSVLNAAGTTTLTYSYYDAAHGYGSVQSIATAAATFSGVGVGSTATYVIPSGRIVIAATAETPASMTSGTYVIEAVAPRAY